MNTSYLNRELGLQVFSEEELIEEEFFSEQNYQEFHVLRHHDAMRLLQAGIDNSTSGDNSTTDDGSGSAATSYYYYSGSSSSDVLASAGGSTPMDTMGLLSAIGGAFADVLSINPFAIDPNQAKLTIAFCCCLMFLMIVGVWYFRKMEAHDREAFEMYVASRKKESTNEEEKAALGTS